MVLQAVPSCLQAIVIDRAASRLEQRQPESSSQPHANLTALPPYDDGPSPKGRTHRHHLRGVETLPAYLPGIRPWRDSPTGKLRVRRIQVQRAYQWMANWRRAPLPRWGEHATWAFRRGNRRGSRSTVPARGFSSPPLLGEEGQHCQDSSVLIIRLDEVEALEDGSHMRLDRALGHE